MTKPMKIMIISLAVVFGGLVAWNVLKAIMIKRFFASYQPPPEYVSTTTAKEESWHPYLEAVGTLKAINGVDVSTQQDGIVAQIYFNSGQLVKKGQPLISLDDSVERAQLEDKQAAMALASLNYKRQLDLYPKHATPESSVDEAKSQLAQAKAGVDQIQAVIAQKNIVAPFDGKIGIRQINIGQFVSAGTKMVSLQSLNPLYVNFYVPEQYLSSLYYNQPVNIQVELEPNQWIAGRITAINSEVDADTHNIMIQATIPNDQMKLYPGLFASVKIILAEQNHIIQVPQTAVVPSLSGDIIYVVEKTGQDKDKHPILKVYKRKVLAGEQQEDHITILQGLKAGEQVVTSGQLKLNDGTRVEINNAVQLTPSRPIQP